MFDLIALKDFLVLCQTKSFSKAADRCHVSVSGLSRRIQSLEQWLGAPVFDRRKQSLDLTEAGHRLQAVSSEIVYALEGLRKSIRLDGDRRALEVRFAAPHIMSAIFFTDWITRLHSEFSSAKFSVNSDLLPECFQMLEEGSADFVVALADADGGVQAQLGDRDLGHYPSLDLGQERLMPVCAADAQGEPRMRLETDREESVSFLGYAPECHLGWALQPLLAAHPELRLDQRHSSTLTDGLRVMALSGLGVAWLPQTLIRHDLESGKLVRAGEPSLDVPLRFTVLRRPCGLPAQTERIWSYLKALAEQKDPVPALTEFGMSHIQDREAALA